MRSLLTRVEALTAVCTLGNSLWQAGFHPICLFKTTQRSAWAGAVGAQLLSVIWRQWPCQAVAPALRAARSWTTSLDPLSCLWVTWDPRLPPPEPPLSLWLERRDASKCLPCLNSVPGSTEALLSLFCSLWKRIKKKNNTKPHNPLWKNPVERDPALGSKTIPFVSAGFRLRPRVVCCLLKGVKQAWDKQCHELF